MSIYFIYEKPEVPTHDILEFKIGESNDPVSRCKNLQTGNKRKLNIYKTIFCGTKPAAQALEATIHERYAHRRISGEWFKINRVEIDQIITEIMKLREAEILAAQKRYFTKLLSMSS